jgi:hippurate hydrolase
VGDIIQESRATSSHYTRATSSESASGPQLPSNHSPLFAPVPKPTIETGVEAMTLAVLSTFDQHARGK